MKDYTIILTKILGKDRYEQLVDYSFKEVQVKFGNIRTDRVTKIVKINHQALMIISILKARFGYWNNENITLGQEEIL